MATPPRPIESSSRHLGTSFRSQLESFTARSPIAEFSIARDLSEDPGYDEDHPDPVESSGDDEDSDSETSTVRPDLQRATSHSMAGSYQRPAFIAAGPRPTVIPAFQPVDRGYLTKAELIAVRKQERSLLRDNHVLPPKKRARRPSVADNVGAKFRRFLGPGEEPDSAADEPSETTGLLGADQGGAPGPHRRRGSTVQKWEEAISAGKIQTTWQREAKVIAQYSRSLILTFLLQYSLTVASIFTVGHIGKNELGAVSLASMTGNITGYAIYQGLATSLDTLCPQAYGSGRKQLVGLQLQRMVYFLWVITIPIGIVWLLSAKLLTVIVPEKEIAELAGLYLKVILFGAPGYAAFESGKRFLQAQGLFSATLYVLLFCAPFNAFMNWLFVWKFEMGFIGAPIAVAITDNLLPLGLFLYVQFVDGKECWGGFTKRAFKNWGPMIRLALPGLVMVEAEFLAFEILTLAASFFSATHLAAQSVLATLTSITFQIPFPVSIAASTRIANLIGATLPGAAKITARVAISAAVIIGIINVSLLSSLRWKIAPLFTNDKDVIELVVKVLPLCAAFQLFDALAAVCNGILRGLGRQEVGGYVNLFCYYVIAMPISFGVGFGLHWELFGLWAGPALALGLVAGIEALFIYRVNWDKAVEEAQLRNTMT